MRTRPGFGPAFCFPVFCLRHEDAPFFSSPLPYSPLSAVEVRSTAVVELPHIARSPQTELPHIARLADGALVAASVLLALKVMLEPHMARVMSTPEEPHIARLPHIARRSVTPVPQRLEPHIARLRSTVTLPFALTSSAGLAAGPCATAVEASAEGMLR